MLKIDYEFGGESRTGLIFLPAMERNRYYTVCCLISNTGKFTVEYMVADWEEGDSWDDLIFDYPLLHQSAFGRTDRLDGTRRGPDDLL